MSKYCKQLGGRGEMQAELLLVRAGYRILERNYHTPFGELDIVALDKGSIVFIEVKTRSSRRYGTALHAVTPLKMNRMIKSALFFISKHRYDEMNYRFDVVAVTTSNGNRTVEHIKNAFVIDREYSL